MNTTSSSTALVLGGGGSTGNAWLIGVIAGLYEAGLDVTSADLTIGHLCRLDRGSRRSPAHRRTELFAAILGRSAAAPRPKLAAAARQ